MNQSFQNVLIVKTIVILMEYVLMDSVNVIVDTKVIRAQVKLELFVQTTVVDL